MLSSNTQTSIYLSNVYTFQHTSRIINAQTNDLTIYSEKSLDVLDLQDETVDHISSDNDNKTILRKCNTETSMKTLTVFFTT